MATNTKREQQRPSMGRPRNPRKDKMKARRKMSKDEKDRRYMARIERKALAAQMAVCCSSCGKAGKILSRGVPPLLSAPPLWLMENPWLLEIEPLCAGCIEAGARVEMCFEGGNLHHNMWQRTGGRLDGCADCGHDESEDERFPDEALIHARLEGAVAAREAEIGYLVRRMATLPSGLVLSALTTRLERLRVDRDWTARRLAGSRDELN
jgi:hypothetical protein